MSEQHLINFHYAYMSMLRHWHPESEPYTGGDALFTAVEEGWQINPTIEYEAHWLLGGRMVTVYHFTLERNGETLKMPVLTNPYVRRALYFMDVTLVELADKKSQPAIRR